mmetsp:Transcript_82788/g.268157  ORF Transcript_82788/g.268157 Transcript_82788/m.268157 type:complete len:237 (+) Transcript_82788:654-1364(+)
MPASRPPTPPLDPRSATAAAAAAFPPPLDIGAGARSGASRPDGATLHVHGDQTNFPESKRLQSGCTNLTCSGVKPKAVTAASRGGWHTSQPSLPGVIARPKDFSGGVASSKASWCSELAIEMERSEAPRGRSSPESTLSTPRFALEACTARRSRRKTAGPTVYFTMPSVNWIKARKTMGEKPWGDFGRAGPKALMMETGKPFTLGNAAQAAAAPRCCVGVPATRQHKTPMRAPTAA